MSYQKLITFGDTLTNSLPVYNNDPLTFCIGSNASQAFNHGSNAAIYGQNSPECQVYMSQRCAKNWDGVCEYAASHKANEEYATRADTMGQGMKSLIDLTPGEVLLRNTAMEKYRVGMQMGSNCELKTEQFNPINPSSPYMSYYVGNGCVPEYAVDPLTIDMDPVMNKLLDRPKIAMQLLLNIKNTMRRNGTLGNLIGTRLGTFYGLGPPLIRENYTTPALATEGAIAISPYLSTGIPPTISGLVPVQIDGLGLPGTSDYYPYSTTLNYVDYWPTRYIAGIPYDSVKLRNGRFK
jgi:hypothetical protein